MKINLLFLLAIPISVFGQKEHFINLNIQDGLASNRCYGLFQDRKGLMYFGTDNGFSIYDGFTFENYTLEDKCPDLEILNFYEDSKNRIWLGTYNQNMGFLFQGNIFNSIQDQHLVKPKTSPYPTHGMLELKNKEFLLFNFKNNAHYMGKNQLHFNSASLAAALYLNDSLVLIKKDGIYLNKGSNTSHIFPIQNIFTNNQIAYEENGQVFIFQNNCITHYNIRQNKKTKTSIACDNLFRIKLIKNKLYCFYKDKSIGVFQICNTEMHHEATYRFASTPQDIFIDLQGNIWVSTESQGIFVCYHSVQQAALKNNTNKPRLNLSIDHQTLIHHVAQYVPIKKANRLPNNSYLCYGYEGIYTYHNKKITQLHVAAARVESAWLTEDSILYYFSNGQLLKWNCITKKESILLKNHFVKLSALCKQSEYLIVSATGQGLYLIKNDVILHNLSYKSDLKFKNLEHLIPYNNYIYDITEEAVLTLKISQEKILFHSIYSVKNGLLPNKPTGFFLDNQLHILCKNEMISIPLQPEKNNSPAQPNIFFNKCVQGNIITNIDATKTINLNSNPLKIFFKKISFGDQENQKLYYSLNHGVWQQIYTNFIELHNYNYSQIEIILRCTDLNDQLLCEEKITLNVRRQLWQIPWFYSSLIGFTIIIALLIWIYYKGKINRTKFEQKNLENEMLRLEQQANQALMHPHFIFNVLGSIQNFINSNKKEEANRYLSKFAKLIRLNLESSSQPGIEIEEEIRIIQSYLELEKLRIGDSFQYHIHFEDNLEIQNSKIPSMMIQPIIENAIWHGLAARESEKLIEIQIVFINALCIQISIADNGVGIDNTTYNNDEKRSIALKTIKSRLDIFSKLYNQNYTFEYQVLHKKETEFPGTVAIIQLPILK